MNPPICFLQSRLLANLHTIKVLQMPMRAAEGTFERPKGRETGGEPILIHRAADGGGCTHIRRRGVCRCGIMDAVHPYVAGGQLRAFVHTAVGVNVEDMGGVGEAHDNLLDSAVLQVCHGDRQMQKIPFLCPVCLGLHLHGTAYSREMLLLFLWFRFRFLSTSSCEST
jgi:hypothetical protein